MAVQAAAAASIVYRGFAGPIEVMYKVFLPFKGCAREGVFAELSFG